ncbi:helix-turn-helix domain-containing protein [Lentilactobacillus kisonensis]|uniref:helix-turn-helix domain-containing protein n=1 Tax=Lentilactobacillus kisonensis TaxID=481722 RepID=UPI000AF06317|nr:helix-turn-helix transcriptional regulator [Lentilactobacillus kisonensis]
MEKKLHDARVAKGFTLDDLQKNTKIQKRYLIAIEDNDFDALPGEFYVRAFVKQYADSVGLDGTELLNQYEEKLPDTEDPEYVDRVNDDNPETRSAQRKVDQRNEKIRRYIPIASVSVIVLIILIAIWVAAARSTRDTSKTQIETSKVSVSGNKNKQTKSSSKAASKSKAKTAKKKAVTFKKVTASGSDITYQVSGIKGKTTLRIAAAADATSAWTAVSGDGSTLWQAALTGGKSHTVTIPSSTSTVTINAGNASQTAIYVGGKN